jgi:cell division protein FtsL
MPPKKNRGFAARDNQASQVRSPSRKFRKFQDADSSWHDLQLDKSTVSQDTQPVQVYARTRRDKQVLKSEEILNRKVQLPSSQSDALAAQIGIFKQRVQSLPSEKLKLKQEKLQTTPGIIISSYS